MGDEGRVGQGADTALAWALRAATMTDADEIANVWHTAWGDGHRGHVPEGLHRHRGLDDFRERVGPRLPATTVAVTGARVIGFVAVAADELEQLFVTREARGSGVAAALLRHGEATIALGHDAAWLAVVAGNARARRFYERHGWRDAGALPYLAETPGGSFSVPSRRYEKRVRP